MSRHRTRRERARVKIRPGDIVRVMRRSGPALGPLEVNTVVWCCGEHLDAHRYGLLGEHRTLWISVGSQHLLKVIARVGVGR